MTKSNQQLTLLELQERLKEKVEDSFLDMLWISASIAQISVNPSGHCYITLIENDESGLVAKASAIIWASTFRVLRPFFETTAGQPLGEGMKILVRVRVQYSELYGLSLIISDIDPSFTIGEAMLQKQRTIARLEKEGMMDLNSTTLLPTLPRRIAIVSARNAAGYGDFMKHLHENEYGFSFFTELFSAPLQGSEAPSGIIAALDRIAARESEFDAVVIMRGGGSATDLACFDDYELCVNVAQFPLPVLTAVGHERDYHIIDMVAYQSVKTPTAGADFFVDIFADNDAEINSLATRLLMSIKSKKSDALNHIEMLKLRMASNIASRIAEQRRQIDLLEMRLTCIDPSDILSRGFVLPLQNGHKVLSVNDLEENDELTLMFKDGSVDVVVKNKKMNNG